METLGVVVVDVIGHEASQVVFVQDDWVIEPLSANGCRRSARPYRSARPLAEEPEWLENAAAYGIGSIAMFWAFERVDAFWE